MIEIDLTIPLTIDDQEKLTKDYARDGDGLTFKEYCSKILKQECRWALDNYGRAQR